MIFFEKLQVKFENRLQQDFEKFGSRWVICLLRDIEKMIQKQNFLIFSLLLSPFNTFQFHLQPTYFF